MKSQDKEKDQTEKLVMVMVMVLFVVVLMFMSVIIGQKQKKIFTILHPHTVRQEYSTRVYFVFGSKENVVWAKASVSRCNLSRSILPCLHSKLNPLLESSWLIDQQWENTWVTKPGNSKTPRIDLPISLWAISCQSQWRTSPRRCWKRFQCHSFPQKTRSPILVHCSIAVPCYICWLSSSGFRCSSTLHLTTWIKPPWFAGFGERWVLTGQVDQDDLVRISWSG